jgi:hypothetical protein
LLATVSAASAHPTGWRGGFPTGRPWDFASGRCHGFPRITVPRAVTRPTPSGRPDGPFPDPLPRIRRPSPSATRAPLVAVRDRPAVTGRLWRPGSDAASCRGTLSPRCAASRAATLTRIVSLALFYDADEFRVARGACAAIRRCGPRIPRLTVVKRCPCTSARSSHTHVAGRRLPPCPLLVAAHG